MEIARQPGAVAMCDNPAKRRSMNNLQRGDTMHTVGKQQQRTGSSRSFLTQKINSEKELWKKSTHHLRDLSQIRGSRKSSICSRSVHQGALGTKSVIPSGTSSSSCGTAESTSWSTVRCFHLLLHTEMRVLVGKLRQPPRSADEREKRRHPRYPPLCAA